MKRTWHIFLSVLIWCGLLAYLIFAARLCAREKKDQLVRDVQVTVLDEARIGVITPDMVKLWLEQEGFDLRNTEIDRVDTERIRQMIARRGFVKSVRVYTDLTGILHIDLSQRMPIARVNTVNGYNFYVTDDGWILPPQRHCVLYVPVITGNFSLPFERDFIGSYEALLQGDGKKVSENYLFFIKLINFVKLIRDNSFWNAQIVQVQVKNRMGNDGRKQWEEPEVEIVPRIGSHVVAFGSLDDVQQKLDKLMLFYRRVLNREGWDAYRTINLKYKGQVVCTK